MITPTFNVRRAGAVLATWLAAPRRRLLLAVYVLAAIWVLPQGSSTGESLVVVAQAFLLAVIGFDGARVAYRKFGGLLAVAVVLVVVVTWLLVTGIWLV